MLGLTKKTGYGLIALAHLADGEGDRLCSAREIADQYDVPVSLLMNVLKELAAVGLVESVRGSRGGYRLVGEPEQINVADVVTLLEGPVRMSECARHRQDDDHVACDVIDTCPSADPIHRVQRRIADCLKTVTLAELVAPRQQTRRTRKDEKAKSWR